MHRMSLLLAALLLVTGADVRGGESGFLDRALRDGDETRRYQVFVPRSYDPNRPWPVILFLHGGGEEGSDGYRQTTVGLGPAIRWNPERFAAIVVFPQLRKDHQWTGGEAEFALRTLDAVEREFRTDPDRVYLTGLSRGGRGSYYIAYRHPSRFAAILVACGQVGPLAPTRADGTSWLENSLVVPEADGDPFAALGQRLQDVPLWVFHGDEDSVIPVDQSRRLVAALRERGATVRYTELSGVGHGSWDSAYQSAEVIEWLFAQRRGSN